MTDHSKTAGTHPQSNQAPHEALTSELIARLKQIPADELEQIKGDVDKLERELKEMEVLVGQHPGQRDEIQSRFLAHIIKSGLPRFP